MNMDMTAITPSAVLLSLDAEPGDFDYGEFLQDDEMDYLGEDPGMSSNSADSPTAKTSSSTELVSRNSQPQKQRQRLERRGHTKSRRGCFNCKRRRIKVSTTCASYLGTV
jgi:hypothetical protein